MVQHTGVDQKRLGFSKVLLKTIINNLIDTCYFDVENVTIQQ